MQELEFIRRFSDKVDVRVKAVKYYQYTKLFIVFPSTADIIYEAAKYGIFELLKNAQKDDPFVLISAVRGRMLPVVKWVIAHEFVFSIFALYEAIPTTDIFIYLFSLYPLRHLSNLAICAAAQNTELLGLFAPNYTVLSILAINGDPLAKTIPIEPTHHLINAMAKDAPCIDIINFFIDSLPIKTIEFIESVAHIGDVGLLAKILPFVAYGTNINRIYNAVIIAGNNINHVTQLIQMVQQYNILNYNLEITPHTMAALKTKLCKMADVAYFEYMKSHISHKNLISDALKYNNIDLAEHLYNKYNQMPTHSAMAYCLRYKNPKVIPLLYDAGYAFEDDMVKIFTHDSLWLISILNSEYTYFLHKKISRYLTLDTNIYIEKYFNKLLDVNYSLKKAIKADDVDMVNNFIPRADKSKIKNFILETDNLKIIKLLLPYSKDAIGQKINNLIKAEKYDVCCLLLHYDVC